MKEQTRYQVQEVFAVTVPVNGVMLQDWDGYIQSSNQRNETGAELVLFATMMTMVTLLTIVGNILVVISIFTYKPMRTVQNFFLVSLAVADLTVGILVMPFHITNYIIGYWIFGCIFCDVWLTFDILCCTASILNLCGIALDRYWAIHNPINYAQKRTFKRVLLMVFIIWCASAAISIPPLLGWRPGSSDSLYDENNKICHLTDDPGYVIYSSSGSFYIPLCIMTFVYIKIFTELRKRLRKRSKTLAVLREAEANSRNRHTIKTELESSELLEREDQENNQSHSWCGCYPTNQSNGGREQKIPLKPCKRSRQESTDSSDTPNPKQESLFAEKQRISLSKERKAAKTLGAVMGAFIICWLPFFLVYVIVPLCGTCTRPARRIETFVVWLGYVNSTMNPVIYVVLNNEFRRSLKYLLQRQRNGGQTIRVTRV